MLTQSTETMEEGLARKKRIHTGHKASATRILTQVDKLLSAADPASTADIVKRGHFKAFGQRDS